MEGFVITSLILMLGITLIMLVISMFLRQEEILKHQDDDVENIKQIQDSTKEKQ